MLRQFTYDFASHCLGKEKIEILNILKWPETHTQTGSF